MRDYKNNKKHFFIKSCVTNAFEDVYKGKTTTLVIIFYLVIHPYWFRIDIDNNKYNAEVIYLEYQNCFSIQLFLKWYKHLKYTENRRATPHNHLLFCYLK